MLKFLKMTVAEGRDHNGRSSGGGFGGGRSSGGGERRSSVADLAVEVLLQEKAVSAATEIRLHVKVVLAEEVQLQEKVDLLQEDQEQKVHQTEHQEDQKALAVTTPRPRRPRKS